MRAAQSCPTEPWRVGKKDRERSGALLWGARWRAQSQSLQFPVSIHVVRDWRVPGCGSAPACRCAENAVLRAGRAHSSTLQSRRRCGRRGTAERKCHTDLDRAERSGPGRAVLAPGEGTHGGMEGMRARADSYREGNEDSKQSGSGWGGLVAGEGVGSP